MVLIYDINDMNVINTGLCNLHLMGNHQLFYYYFFKARITNLFTARTGFWLETFSGIAEVKSFCICLPTGAGLGNVC